MKSSNKICDIATLVVAYVLLFWMPEFFLRGWIVAAHSSVFLVALIVFIIYRVAIAMDRLNI